MTGNDEEYESSEEMSIRIVIARRSRFARSGRLYRKNQRERS